MKLLGISGALRKLCDRLSRDFGARLKEAA
jgi:hypothetical protein